MGVGKSTIGKILARRLKTSFVDCDHAIENRTGVTVNTIFEIEGEAGFRRRETCLLEELSENEAGVIATGGGVVTQDENRSLLKQVGGVIYLNASIDLLWSRLRYCKNRPLLQTENPRARLRALLKERDPLYREVASCVLNVKRGPASKMVSQIERLIERNEI